MSESPVDEVMSIVQPTTVNYDARMRLRGQSELMVPGVCCVCGSGNSDHYVDIGVYYEYEGQMYLCLNCLTEAAETGGMLSIEVGNHLKELATQIATTNTELVAQVKEMSERLGHFDAIIASSNPSPTPDSSVSVSVPNRDDVQAQSGNTTSNDGSVAEPTGQGKPDESEPVKSGKGKVTARISSTTGNDKNSK